MHGSENVKSVLYMRFAAMTDGMYFASLPLQHYPYFTWSSSQVFRSRSITNLLLGYGENTALLCKKCKRLVLAFRIIWLEIISFKPFCKRASWVSIHVFRVVRWWLSEDAGNFRLSLYFVTWFTYLLIILYYPTEEDSFRMRMPFFF